MRIGVPRELYAGERRVATTPDVASQLIKLGFDVAVESNAGAAANYSDTSSRKPVVPLPAWTKSGTIQTSY